MTVRPGEPWGAPLDAETDPSVLPVAHDDHTLARIAHNAAISGIAPVLVRLTGGDLHKTLGSPSRTEGLMVHPVDLGRVVVDDGEPIPFVAHVVARRVLWTGRFIVVANAAFLTHRRDAWNVAPRAHPGDGRFDMLEGALDLRQRLMARRRAVAGTHVPHVDIEVGRIGSKKWDLDAGTVVRVDDRSVGRSRTMAVELVAGAVLAVC